MRLNQEMHDKDIRDELAARPTLWPPSIGGAHLDTLFGLQVIESPLLTKTITVTKVRTWRERLCTWPWRPWVGRVVHQQVVPSDEVLLVNADRVGMTISGTTWEPPQEFSDSLRLRGKTTIVVHPETRKALRGIIDKGQLA
jgi:hypothetical protein